MIPLSGNWTKGWAICDHTERFFEVGREEIVEIRDEGEIKRVKRWYVPQAIYTRSYIAEFLYILKYKIANSLYFGEKLKDIANEIIDYLAKECYRVLVELHNKKEIDINKMDAIIPVPSSMKGRLRDPVQEIAKKISEHAKINIGNVDTDYLIKTKDTPPLKNIDDLIEREAHLKDAFDVRDDRYKDKSILVFDDIYRSGQTLTEITRTLYNKGNVKEVYVVVLTKTTYKK
jgi:predicted amidophosphoribosyltransferase